MWAIGNYLEPLDGPPPSDVRSWSPAYHKNGLFFTSVALSNGIGFISLPRFDARTYLESVARYRCTILSGIPTMFALMAREKDLLARLDLGSVTLVTIGSAPLTEALLDRVRGMFPNALLQNGYGTTEAGPAVFGPHPDGRPRPGVALGVPYWPISRSGSWVAHPRMKGYSRCAHRP